MPAFDKAVDAPNAAKKTGALLRDARGFSAVWIGLAGMADASAPPSAP